MNNWIEDNICAYYSWLKDNTLFRQDEQTGWSVISTPFQGLFNDAIEIFVKKMDNNAILLSDDGLTLANLELAGVTISRSPKRKEWLDYILCNYGVEMDGNEMIMRATPTTFPQQKHNLIQAIMEVSDMEISAKHTVNSLFKEDVKAFLNEQNIIYTPQFITKGKLGLEFTFDFQIAGRENEIVIKAFNSLNKTNVPNFIWGLEDIKENRQKQTGKGLSGIALVNDVDKEIKTEYLDAFKSVGTDYILWSDRHNPDNRHKLIA